MNEPNLKIMNENIFLVIEHYLVAPTQALAAQIKVLSHSLANNAYQEATIKFPGKKIGADEWQPILLANIHSLVKEAFPYSTRLKRNQKVEANDPEYIFRLSKPQQEQIYELKNDLLNQKGKDALHPDGLIYAYAGYIERRTASNFTYCDGIEASAYDHNAQLYLKAKNMTERGYDPVARVLKEACSGIKEQLQSSSPETNKYQQITAILQQAKRAPEVQTHRGEVKTIIINFLLMISLVGAVFLAVTEDKRGSFWYRPNTDSENKVADFEEDLSLSLFKKGLAGF